MATAFGALLAVNWLMALCTLLVVAVGLLLSRRMSVGSILGAAAFPVISHFMEPGFFLIGIAMAIIVIYKHKANINRLIKGEEPRMF